MLVARPRTYVTSDKIVIAISSGEEGGKLSTGEETIKENDTLVFVSRSTSQFGQITKAIGRVDPELPEKPQVAILSVNQSSRS